MLAARRRHPAFGEGTFEVLAASDDSVLAFVRDHTGPDGRRDRVVCVNNLAAALRSVTFSLPEADGRLAELNGEAELPLTGGEPCRLELPARGVRWFAIVPPEPQS
jgi:maltose alpha-D-glucosyltransferase/alpha-amylase